MGNSNKLSRILSSFSYLSPAQNSKHAIRTLFQILWATFLSIFSHPQFSSFERCSLGPFLQIAALCFLLRLCQKKTPFAGAILWATSSFFTYLFLLRWLGASPYLQPWGMVGQWLTAALLAVAPFFWALFLSHKRPSSLAFFWGLLEWSRQFWFCGFPWYPLSLCLVDSTIGTDLLALLGPFMSSAVLLRIAFVLSKGSWKTIFFKIATLFSALSIFSLFSRMATSTYRLPVQVAALHSNKALHNLDKRIEIWDRLVENAPLWSKAPWNCPRFCLTPEGFLPGGLVEPVSLKKRGFSNSQLASLLSKHWHCLLALGVEDDRTDGIANALALWNKEGESKGCYHKKKLVPFGEYFPCAQWPWIGPWLIDRCRSYGVLESLVPGRRTGRYSVEGLELLFSICFEETFASSIAQEARKGARLWMSASNDAWYPESSLAYDHLLHARLISASTGLPLVRSTQQGYTCFLDGRGQVQGKKLAPDEPLQWRVETALTGCHTAYSYLDENLILALSFLYFFGRSLAQKKLHQKKSKE